jgi:hypothetical protein
MKYELYVGENCHDCKKICKTIVEMQFDIPVKNIDLGDTPPRDLFILPALLNQQGDIKAYGVDIVDFLKDPVNRAPRMSLFKRMMKFIKDHC